MVSDAKQCRTSVGTPPATAPVASGSHSVCALVTSLAAPSFPPSSHTRRPTSPGRVLAQRSYFWSVPYAHCAPLLPQGRMSCWAPARPLCMSPVSPASASLAP